MNVTDETKVRRVWSRVMNTQSMEKTAPANRITPELLASMVQQELDTAATYRYIACRMNGCAREILQRLAEQEKCHAKKLAAYYYLLTGKKLCTGKGKALCVTGTGETLRQLYNKELADSKRCRELAPLAAERSCTFQTLSREEYDHAQRIFCILQKAL